MVNTKIQKPEESLANLTDLEVPGFLNDFHQSSICGISMLAGTFSGLAKALKTQDTRCDSIESTLGEINDKMQEFAEIMKQTQSRVESIAEKVEKQIGEINDRFEEVGKETDKKIEESNNELRNVVKDSGDQIMKQMRQETKKMVSKIASNVKNTENQIKLINKTCQENRDKIDVTKTKMEETRNQIKETVTNMNQRMNALQDNVEKTTSDLKEMVETTATDMIKRVEDADKKFQEFQFQTEKELSLKADLDRLKTKLEIPDFKRYQEELVNQQSEQDNTVDTLKDEFENEKKITEEHNNNYNEKLDNAEKKRNEIQHELDVIKSRYTNIPDPTTMIERFKQDMLEQMSQMEAVLREECKARSSSGGVPPPSFGSADGSCFSCGRGGAFPAMPARSPKQGSGGGFGNRNSPAKIRKMKSSATVAQLSPHHNAPQKLSTSHSLPTLPSNETKPHNKISNGEVEEVKLPAISDKVEGNISRPSSRGVAK